MVGRMLGGAAIPETIFAIPGIGRTAVDAIFSRNFPIVQGAVVPQFDSADAAIERSASGAEGTSTVVVPEVESARSTNSDAAELLGQPPAVVETIQNGNGEVGIEF